MRKMWPEAGGPWPEQPKPAHPWDVHHRLRSSSWRRRAKTVALPALRDPRPETRNPVLAPRGYILFETIIAMTVLSLAIMVVNEGMRQAILSRALSEDFTTARFLMEEILSGMELQPRVMEGMEDKGQFTGIHSRFSYEWKITTIEVPVPPLPAGLEPVQRESLERMFRPYIAKFAVTIHWTRAGVAYDALGETLLPPERLWRPEEVPAQ